MASSVRANDTGAATIRNLLAAEKPGGSTPPHEDFGVLVGWSHQNGPQGISLAMQSAASQAAWAAREIDRRHYLMTRNQALLLARYLLETTGQQLDLPERAHGWRAALARFRGKRV